MIFIFNFIMDHGIPELLLALSLITTCASKDLLFVGTDTVVRYYDPSDPYDHGIYVPLENVSSITAVDYDPLEGYLYWEDSGLGSISRARLNGADQEVIISDIGQSKSLVLDVESRKIYWINTSNNTIERSWINGTGREVLVNGINGSATSLALDTVNGLMYWAVNINYGGIKRSDLNGQNPEVLVDMSYMNRVPFTLDPVQQRLYWYSNEESYLTSADTDGNNIQQLYDRDLVYHYIDENEAVAEHGDYTYILEYDIILRLNKSANNSLEVFLVLPWYYDQILAMNINNRTYLWLISYTFYGEYRSYISEVYLDIENDWGRPVPSLIQENVVAIDYDPSEDMIYWIDYWADSIKRSCRNGTEIQVLTNDVIHCHQASLAVSWQTNELFWTCGYDIERMTLSGDNRISIINNTVKATSLAVDMTEKFLYWTTYGDNGTIERANYTGGEHTVILYGLVYASNIVLDVVNEVMYWLESNSGQLQTATLNGSTVQEIPLTSNIYHFTLLGDFIYFISESGLLSISKSTLAEQTIHSYGGGYFTNIKIVQDILFVSTTRTICYYDLLKPYDHGTQIPLENVTHIIGVDYDPEEGYIYWADSELHVICRSRINGTAQEIILHDIDSVSALTLDVKSRMLYWTDTWNSTIERSFLNGSCREIILNKYIVNQPGSIFVDTDNEQLYWSDIGSEAFIESANLNGNGRNKIMHITASNLDITFDSLTHRLLWGDAYEWNLYSADSDGSNQDMISINHHYYSALTSYGNYTYYIDYIGNVIELSMNYTSSVTTEKVMICHKYDFNYESIYTLPLIKGVKTDDGKNILLVPCWMEYGFWMEYEPSPGVNEVYLDIEKDWGRPVPSLIEENVVAIDYDPSEDMIYWINYWTDSIKRSYRNGTDIQVLANVTDCYDLEISYDWYYASLAVSWQTNELFWTCGYDIERMTLSGDNRISIINNTVRATSLAVDMTEKYIYWASVYNNGTIECALFTGENQKVLISGLDYPRSLVMDVSDNVLYWIEDYPTQYIHAAMLNGTIIKSIDVGYDIFALTVLDGNFYISNIYGPIKKFSKNHTELLLSNGRFKTIKRVPNVNGCSSNPCQNNGHCVDDTHIYKCECAGGFTGNNCESTVSPCQNSPCLHGGICNIIDKKVICICQGNWYGEVCQYGILLVISLSPQVGPVAGGTKITISGSAFPSADVYVTVGNIAKCTTLSSNTSTIIVATPPVDDKYAGKDYQIFVWFNNRNLNFSLDYNFRFKANPSVKSIHPLRTLAKGGTKLTVSGKNFDAVDKPLLKLDKVVQIINNEGNLSTLINETITTYYGICNRRNETNLVCVTPDIESASDNTFTISQSGTSVRKRRELSYQQFGSLQFIFERIHRYLLQYLTNKPSSNKNYLPVVHRRQKRDIKINEKLYIGIILDGVNEFKNLSANDKTKEYGELEPIYTPPTFKTQEETQSFVFKPDNPVNIKGNHVNEIPRDDYQVDIGKGLCEIKDVKENVLQCLPPQKEPPRDGQSPPHEHLIVIHIGQNIKEDIGQLTYPSHSNLYMGLGFSAIVVSIIFAITLIVAIRRRASVSSRRRNSETDPTFIHLPPVNCEFSNISSIPLRHKQYYTSHNQGQQNVSVLLGRGRPEPREWKIKKTSRT